MIIEIYTGWIYKPGTFLKAVPVMKATIIKK